MSLISIAWRAHLDFPLILLCNHDARHDRPTAPAADWPADSGYPGLLAGRDLQGGGTWLGVNRHDSRFALVTACRDASSSAQPPPADTPSRGLLPLAYFASGEEPVVHARRYARDKGPYAPFNLLLGNARQVHYAATRSRLSVPLTEGVHVLGNGLLDQRWPNAERLDTVFGAYIKAIGGLVVLVDGFPKLRDALAHHQMVLPVPDDVLTPADIAAAGFVMLADRATSSDGLPDTGLGTAEERRRSAPFVLGPDHGTRSSTVLVMARDGRVHFEERRFDAAGAPAGTVLQQWTQDAAVFGAPD